MSNWKYQRLFEILPGAIVWFLLLSPLVLSIVNPKALAIVMIFYLSFWLVKVFFMSYRMIIGYRKYRSEMAINWLSLLEQMAPEDAWKNIHHLVLVPTYKEDVKILESSVKSVINSRYPLENIVYVLATEERDFENAT